MAFITAVLKQQRSKKDTGHINQAAISPWLSTLPGWQQRAAEENARDTFPVCSIRIQLQQDRAGPSQGCWEHRHVSLVGADKAARLPGLQSPRKKDKLYFKIAFTYATVPRLALILSFLFFFFFPEGIETVEANLLEVCERKQAWMRDTRLSRTSTNFCWQSSPWRWPSEHCWGAWKGCSAYLVPAEPRCAGHTAAPHTTEATSMFSSWTPRSNNLIYTNMCKQTVSTAGSLSGTGDIQMDRRNSRRQKGK